ncbi:phage tail tape measure protein [Bacillus paralicheniformis]|nr:phage tail tape measure protein [Bacillus paralicheniformis]MCV9371096.1 phage tail tape measure protein [Bacillus paralicheniformis]MDI0243736.1 phage tail tape measure protein [Bacillus paralicheniformis]MEC2328885.1 phage tail tape measure protein [Bacillus paralicheniformis]MED0700413.1 phage tail tape measure protein [Bacillus paralicheniformis]WIG07193.1 phage tail tape measure protein [Bacillus paralicheniformis]
MAVKTTADFESAMSRVGALSGATGKQLESMTQTAEHLGATTAFTATQAAEGMQFLAMAGYKTNDIIAAMPGLLATAAAGQTDLATTADITSNILSGFGLQAEETARVADVLTKAFTNSNTDLEMLGYTMKYVAPIAHASGQSLESVAAAAGLLGNAGIQGTQAGTSLRRMLTRLAGPPKAAREELHDLGVTVEDAKGNMKPLAQIIGELAEATKDMGEADRLAAISRISGVEASSAMLALMDAGQGKIEAFTKELENSGGTAEEIAKKQLDNLKGQLIILKSALEGAAIAIGTALLPALKLITKGLQFLVDKFNSLPKPVKSTIAILGAMATVLALVTGPLLILVGMLPGIITGFGLIAEFGALVAPALLPIAGVTAAVIAGLTALGAAIYLTYKHFDTIKKKASEFTAIAGQKVTPVLKTISSLFKGIAETLTGDFTQGSIALHNLLPQSVANVIVKGLASIRSGFDDLKKAITDAFNGDYSGIAEFIPNIIGILVGGIPGLIVAGSKFLPAIAQGIEQNMPTILEKATEIVNSLVNGVTANLPRILQAGLEMITELLEGFTQALPNIVEKVTQVVDTIIQTITTMIPVILATGVMILTSLIEGIVSALPTIIEAATTVLSTLINTVVTLLPMIIEAGIQILTSLISGLIQALPMLVEATIQLITMLIQTIIQNLPTIIEAGIQILISLINGIVSILPKLIEMAIYLIVAVATALIENLPKIIDAGIKLLLALIDGIIKMLPTLIEAALKLIVALAGALIQNLPRIIEAGVRILLALIDGIIQILPQLLQMGLELVVKLGQTILDNKEELFKAGADLIRGLWDGINSMKDWIGQKVGGFVDSLTGNFKSLLGIHSPSRVFRDEIGKFLPMGLAVGIERNIGAVRAAADEMANAAMVDMSGYSYDPAVALNTGGVRSIRRSFEASMTAGLDSQKQQQPIIVENVLVVDSEELGRMTESAVSAEQGQKITIQNYMRGD